MKRLMRLNVLITIILLSCLKSWCQSSATNPSTGGLAEHSDSVLVSYNDLRVANSKMIELKYEKEINKNLCEVIKNDSIIIDNNNKEISVLRNKSVRYKTERNIAGGVGLTAIILFIISIL